MLQDLLEEEWKAFAHHGITPYRSEPVSPCSQGTPSDDAVKVNGSGMTSKLDIIQFGWEVKGVIPSPCIDTGLPVPRVSSISSTLDAKQRGRHAALRVVAATNITCHALSAVYVQHPMDVATHIP